MADTSDQANDRRPEPAPLTLPSSSEIARLAASEAAAAMLEHIRGKPQDIEPVRSGQLSPPHTPGRGG
jgi:hypothetical protein